MTPLTLETQLHVERNTRMLTLGRPQRRAITVRPTLEMQLHAEFMDRMMILGLQGRIIDFGSSSTLHLDLREVTS